MESSTSAVDAAADATRALAINTHISILSSNLFSHFLVYFLICSESIQSFKNKLNDIFSILRASKSFSKFKARKLKGFIVETLPPAKDKTSARLLKN